MLDRMPRRIQLRRRKGWRKPEGAVVVARPSKWGNPFVVRKSGREWELKEPRTGMHTICTGRDPLVRESVQLFERHFIHGELGRRTIREQLGGKDLCCWCRLCDKHSLFGRPWNEPCDDCSPCHADVLLRIANEIPQQRPIPDGAEL